MYSNRPKCSISVIGTQITYWDSISYGTYTTYWDSISYGTHRFCEWCKNNHLTLNVDKTKELLFDYRRKKELLTPLLIDGKIVSIVDSYKYLGLKIDSKLNWSNHAHDVCKKVNQRLYFLRKLRSFKVNPEILFFCFIVPQLKASSPMV